MHRRTFISAIIGTSVVVSTSNSASADNDGSTTSRNDQSSEYSNEPTPTSNRTNLDAGRAGVAFDVESFEITECGFTCREATSTITNTGTEDATNVHVDVNVSAADNHIWETEEAIGLLEAGSSITQSERIDVSFSDALAILSNDRQITIETTISSDQRTVQITRERVV